MSEGFERSFEPIAENNKRYENMYRTYLNLARHGENISLECAEIRKNSKNVDKFSKKRYNYYPKELKRVDLFES